MQDVDTRAYSALSKQNPIRFTGDWRCKPFKGFQQLRVVFLIMEGKKNRRIAKVMATTDQAVRERLRLIFDKVGVSDRLELALYAIHHPAVQMAAADAEAGFEATAANLSQWTPHSRRLQRQDDWKVDPSYMISGVSTLAFF